MKKYILLSLIALGGASCSDSFLDEKMISTITQDYFETEKGLDQLVVGTYTGLRITKQYNQGPSSLLIGTDNTQSKTTNYALYSASEWSASGKLAGLTNALAGEFTNSTLLGFYAVVNDCNRVVQTIQEGKAPGKFATDAHYANQRMSEAMFNRAYAIYMLNTFYGDVYIPTKYTVGLPENYYYVRESSENLYKRIISDLRHAYDYLPDAGEQNLSSDFGRATKGAAAHFLAKVYLQRVQGAKYGSAEYGRKTDGTIDNSNEKSYLGMLYKGNVPTDLDSCIWFATQVIDNPHYELEKDYGKLFSHPLGDYSNENSKELILACTYGGNGADNGRYGNRIPAYIGPSPSNASWGIDNYCWEYGTKVSATSLTNEFGFDIYVNKQADSRYEKSFGIEYETALRGGESTSSPAPNVKYYAYNDAKNTTYKWTEDMADYFNKNILPTYKRESWGGRKAVAGEHKMGKGDLGVAYVENTKATALDIHEALAQPFVVLARWLKDGDKYYYRAPLLSANGTYSFNTKSYAGLDKMGGAAYPGSTKYQDPNRSGYNASQSTRDIPIFRLAETYLIRAEAYGRRDKGDYAKAIADINEVRRRAAYKAGETRAEVIARVQPGHENLAETEQQWPYTVESDMVKTMEIDASYWNGASENSKNEMYPATATTDEERFENFMLNEVAREMNEEMIYYENLHHSGWQADRILYHDQTASPLPNLWDSSDNLINGIGQTGSGMGFFKPCYTLKPIYQTTLDLLTDENGNPLDEASRKAYQNYGY